MNKKALFGILTLLICLFLYRDYIPKSNNTENMFYFLEEKNNNNFVFVGITKDLEVAERLMNIYEKENTKLDLKEVYLRSEELKINIEQFDLLSKKALTKEELLKIQEVVCASYEEVIKKGE